MTTTSTRRRETPRGGPGRVPGNRRGRPGEPPQRDGAAGGSLRRRVGQGRAGSERGCGRPACRQHPGWPGEGRGRGRTPKRYGRPRRSAPARHQTFRGKAGQCGWAKKGLTAGGGKPLAWGDRPRPHPRRGYGHLRPRLPARPIPACVQLKDVASLVGEEKAKLFERPGIKCGEMRVVGFVNGSWRAKTPRRFYYPETYLLTLGFLLAV